MEGSYNPVSAAPGKSSEQYSSAQAVPSAVTVVAPAHHLENTTESWSNFYNNHSNPSSFGRNPPPKIRCRDYDGKLFLIFHTLFPLFCDLFLDVHNEAAGRTAVARGMPVSVKDACMTLFYWGNNGAYWKQFTYNLTVAG